MNENELKAIEFTSCNCDIQGNFNCLMHNPNHPMHIIKALRAQLATLQQEAIEQAVEVERYRLKIKNSAHGHWGRLAEEYGYHGGSIQPFEEWFAKSYPWFDSPQPTIGAKALELVRVGLKINDFLGRLSCLTAEIEDAPIISELFDKAAAFTEDEIRQIGG